MALEFYQPFGILLPVPFVRPTRLLPPIAGLFAAGILALSALSQDLDAPPGISIYLLADPVVPGGGGILQIVISNRDEDRKLDEITIAIDPPSKDELDLTVPWGQRFCPSQHTIPPCISYPRW